MNRMLRALKQLEAKTAANVDEQPAGAIQAADGDEVADGAIDGVTDDAIDAAVVEATPTEAVDAADAGDGAPHGSDSDNRGGEEPEATSSADVGDESAHVLDAADVGDESAEWLDAADVAADAQRAIETAESAIRSLHETEVAEVVDPYADLYSGADGDASKDSPWDSKRSAESDGGDRASTESHASSEPGSHDDSVIDSSEPVSHDDPVIESFEPVSHDDPAIESFEPGSHDDPVIDSFEPGSHDDPAVDSFDGEPSSELPRHAPADSIDRPAVESKPELPPNASPETSWEMSSDAPPDPSSETSRDAEMSSDAPPDPSSETSRDTWTSTRALGATHSPPHLVRRPAAIESLLLEGEPETPLGRSYLALADRISRQWWMQASAALLLVAPDMEPEVCRTAAHLAARLARHGTRDVLLMDCNVTDKSLSDLFELRGKAGLTDVLHGRADAAECVTPTSIDGLFVLPAGRGDARQFDDVTRSVGNLLAQLKQRYRYVIASGDAQEAAGRVIARLCDGTYVLVRLGQTEMEPAALTMQHLLEAGARVLGCVVVNAPEGPGVE